jgi:hypothetical protein
VAALAAATLQAQFKLQHMQQELLTYPSSSSSSMHTHMQISKGSSPSRQQHTMAVRHPPTG